MNQSIYSIDITLHDQPDPVHLAARLTEAFGSIPDVVAPEHLQSNSKGHLVVVSFERLAVGGGGPAAGLSPTVAALKALAEAGDRAGVSTGDRLSIEVGPATPQRADWHDDL